MRFCKIVVAAMVIAIPALLTAVPAEALTAKQYQHQGRGQYLNSTGSRVSGPMHRYGRHHSRSPRHHRYSR